MTLYLGLACIAGALGLAVYLLVAKRAQPAVATDGGFELRPEPVAGPRTGKTATEPSSLFVRAAALAGTLTPSTYADRLQSKLDRAGNPAAMPAERVLALKGFGLAGGVILGLLLSIKHPGIGLLLWPAGLGLALFFLPDVLVKNMGDHRKMALVNGMPDALDTLTVCVEAGLAFDGALSRVARNLEGPMAEECSRMLQEMQFGLSRADALRNLAERTDVTEVRTFASAMIQAGELGISVGGVLREQAQEMRIKRRQRAEEKAQKLAVKILFPLVFFLLPAMFVIVLGPAAMNIMHFFAQSK